GGEELSAVSLNRTWMTLQGTTTWETGDIKGGINAKIINTGAFKVTSFQKNTITAEFVNNGSFKRTGVLGQTVIDANFTNSATASVTIDEGEFDFQQSTTFAGVMSLA